MASHRAKKESTITNQGPLTVGGQTAQLHHAWWRRIADDTPKDEPPTGGCGHGRHTCDKKDIVKCEMDEYSTGVDEASLCCHRRHLGTIHSYSIQPFWVIHLNIPHQVGWLLKSPLVTQDIPFHVYRSGFASRYPLSRPVGFARNGDLRMFVTEQNNGDFWAGSSRSPLADHSGSRRRRAAFLRSTVCCIPLLVTTLAEFAGRRWTLVAVLL